MKTFIKKQKGFSLLEVILSISIFTIGVVGIGLFVIDIQTTAERSQNLSQGILLAEEGLEAVKSIRDNNFDDIIDGTYGLYFVGGIWEFGSGPDMTILGREDDVGRTFTRTITISTSAYNEEAAGDPSSEEIVVKLIKSNVSWPIRDRISDVTLSTLITNWNR
jgi:prepilin-type N-terminal cleavage/methylation domain-containing protein